MGTENDSNNTAITPHDPSSKPGKLSIGKPKPGGLHARLKAVKEIEAQGETIQLLLDCSGSMAGQDGYPEQKIELLRKAVMALVKETDMHQYRIGITTFPLGQAKLPPTNSPFMVELAVRDLQPDGGTPMDDAIRLALETRPSRVIIVSDGEADHDPVSRISNAFSLDGVQKFPFDCVHIGSSERGEQTLRSIAELSGGLYLKFKDLKAFATNFKFLAPQYRAMLMAGDAEKIMGAEEVQ